MKAQRILEIVIGRGVEDHFGADTTDEEKHEFLSYIFTEIVDRTVDKVFYPETVLKKLLDDLGISSMYSILHNPDAPDRSREDLDALFRDDGNLMVAILFWAIFDCTEVSIGEARLTCGDHEHHNKLEFMFVSNNE